MITGDSGRMQTFPGEGYVVAVESEIDYGGGVSKHIVYLKTPAAKQQAIAPPTNHGDSYASVSDGIR
jgi:hypothetical protein